MKKTELKTGIKFELKEYHRNTPDEELIDDLKRVAKLLQKDSVTIEDYEQYGNFHPTTLTRRFGKWTSSLKKAGLQMTRSRLDISNEELFEDLSRVWIKLGEQPSYNKMGELSKFSAGTYEKRFGTWRKALEAFIKYINEDANPEEFDNIKSDNQDGCSSHKTSRAINLRIRFKVLQRDKFKCCSCGASPAKDPAVELHIDHKIPWSKGGESVIDNLQTLCSKCNLGKSDTL